MKFSNYILFFLFLFVSGALQGQGRVKLEKERKRLLKDMEFTKKLLAETSLTKQLSIDQLQTLEKQITLRGKMIRNISNDIQVLSESIGETNNIINALEKDLNVLKDDYARMLYSVYKNRSTVNQLIFIFSAESFNDAYNRLKYLQQYGQFRKRQAELIEETKQTLSAKKEDTEHKKSEKQDLLDEETTHKTKLNEERNKKNQLVASLQKQEKQLKKDMKKQQKTADMLNKKIEEIIKREIAAAKKRAKEEAKEGNVLALTPEAAKLSADFASNQGRLPWPVTRGIISNTFGEHPHPVLKYVKVVNNGIDIKTYDKEKVRSVFDGTVVSVVYNPGFQRAIIVRHGEYFTVYSNLKEVYVRSGDNVNMKQNIGVVTTDEEEGKSDMHFELWKGTQKLNPALWIYSNNP